MRQEVAKPSASRRFWRFWSWAVSRPATPCIPLPAFGTPPFTPLFTPPKKANPFGDDGTQKGFEPAAGNENDG